MSVNKFSAIGLLLLMTLLLSNCRTYYGITPVGGSKVYMTTTGPIFWHRNVAVCDDLGDKMICQDVEVTK